MKVKYVFMLMVLIAVEMIDDVADAILAWIMMAGDSDSDSYGCGCGVL